MLKTSPKSLIPPLSEIKQVLQEKERADHETNRKIAQRVIERCSEELRHGNMKVTHVTPDEDVLSIVIKEFTRCGYKVKKLITEHESTSRCKTKYTYRMGTLIFSVPE